MIAEISCFYLGLMCPTLPPIGSPYSSDLVQECRTRGSCIWIAGKLIVPGSREKPRRDMCERIDPTTGTLAERWSASSTPEGRVSCEKTP